MISAIEKKAIHHVLLKILSLRVINIYKPPFFCISRNKISITLDC